MHTYTLFSLSFHSTAHILPVLYLMRSVSSSDFLHIAFIFLQLIQSKGHKILKIHQNIGIRLPAFKMSHTARLF